MLPILRKSGEKWEIQSILPITASEAHNLARFKERKGDDIFAALDDPASGAGFERKVSLVLP